VNEYSSQIKPISGYSVLRKEVEKCELEGGLA
jgi:hypothetical protein